MLEYAPEAARRAAAAASHREAAQQYARALRFAGGLADRERADLLDLYALEAQLTGLSAEAAEAWQEAIELHRTVGDRLAEELKRLTGFDTRVTVLGHLQRGGSPTAYDRVLATRYGMLAAELAGSGRSGLMTALRGTEVIPVPLADAVKELKTVPREYYALAEAFFG